MSIELSTMLCYGAVSTALFWEAFSREQRPIVLGYLGLAEFIPAALLAIPAGHTADRRDRRWVGAAGIAIMIVSQIAIAIDVAAGDSHVWPLYVAAFVFGVGTAYFGPAVGPLLAAAVDEATLARAVAMNASAMQLAVIVGPALAGLLQLVDPAAPYIFAALCLTFALAALSMIPAAIGRAHVTGEEASFADAIAGLRFIRATPALFGAISLDLVAVLFGGAIALLPVFSQTILHVGAFGNGLLRAAPGIGALVVGAVISTRPLTRRVGTTLFVVVALFGFFTIIFGFSTNFALSMLALAALSGADMVSMSIRATLQPLLTPPPLRGRVGAVESVFIGASNELGAFESGVVAAALGAVPAVVLGGAVSMIVAGVWAWKFPSIRRIDRFEDITPGMVPPREALGTDP